MQRFFGVVDAVDGSEIRLTNQLRLVGDPIIYDGLKIHPGWLALGFLPSTVFLGLGS